MRNDWIMKIDKEVIDKVLDNEASYDEAKRVKEWFSTDEGQEYLSQRLTMESMQMDEKDIDKWVEGNIPTERMRERFLKQIKRDKHPWKWWKIAAVVLPFLLLGSTVIFLANKAGILSPTQYAEITVPCGERMKVVLQDGTIVELNSATTLRYPNKFGLFSREVELDGEGYFTVAKDKGRPFAVQTRGLDVQVTGTQFNVKAYPADSRIFVTLDEGGVLLEAADSRKYPLQPGESAIYDCRSGKCEIIRPVDTDGIKAWRTNSLNFYLTPLREIIKVMERQYDTRFIVEDSTLLDTKFTLSTSKVNVADVLLDLEKVSHIDIIERGENTFEIKRKD